MRHLLIVENGISLGTLYEGTFAKEELEVHIVNDVNEAVRKIDDYVPDMVIVDIKLAEADSFSSLKQILGIKYYPPTIMVDDIMRRVAKAYILNRMPVSI